jgi:hypothetical protein
MSLIYHITSFTGSIITIWYWWWSWWSFYWSFYWSFAFSFAFSSCRTAAYCAF